MTAATLGSLARTESIGFTCITALDPWEQTRVGDLFVTATPAMHVVEEITFVIQWDQRTVFFGGDTMAIPELHELPSRFGHFDLALLPTNGLCIHRPLVT